MMLQSRLYDLSARNPFIHVNQKKLHSVKNGKGNSIKKLHKQAAFYKKEYDLDTSLEIYSFLKWKEPHKEKFYISPLLFKPVKIVLRRKIESEFETISTEDESIIINPILSHSFSRFYDIDFPTELTNIAEFHEYLISALSTKKTQIELVNNFDDHEGWQIIHQQCLGNFNYKKSLLGKDYDRIINDQSSLIQNFLLSTFKENNLKPANVNPILDLDFSQKEVIKISGNSSLVVQGPPGTGKSHTIVGMIGNFLSQGKKVLFISQKRSALDVVYSRLKEFGLGALVGFLNTEKDEKKEFFSELKYSWDQINKLDSSEKVEPKSVHSELIHFYLGKYQNHNEKLSASVHETVIELLQSGFTPSQLKYSGRLPELESWKQHQNFLSELEKKLIDKHQNKTIAQATFSKLNKAVFKEPEPTAILDKRLSELKEVLMEINQVQSKYSISQNFREVFDHALAASILDMVNQTQLNLLDKESKSYKSFSNWAKKYELLKAKVARAEQASKKWKNKPTKSEITELIDLLKHHHAPKGILGILKRRNERLDKAFKDFSPNLSNIAKQQLLEELRNEWNLKAEMDEVVIKLKHNLNIAYPEKDISHILQLRSKLDDISGNAYLRILEHEHSSEIIKDLSELHPKIQNFRSIAQFIFHNDIPDEINEIQYLIDQIQKDLHQIKLLLPDLQRYFMIPFEIRDFIQSRDYAVAHLSSIVAYNKLIEQVRFEAEFDDLQGENIQLELERVMLGNQAQFKSQRKLILQRQKKQISELEELLSTPASKLNEHQKKRKKQFRQIKKTLVHEMSKKQRHMPIKEFCAETWDFLSNIHPIWIMNPLSVSERLNCNKEMFDLVIFDESSQIPLEDAIPSLYRAKQTIVVGDEKQMPPAAFFSSHSEGPTLLDKADVNLPKRMLKWHYRSNHPDLIKFSNQQFYENELLTVPPVDVETPIEFKKVNGIFNNGVNQEEANYIAAYLSENDVSPESLGIIAFSKDQENLIRKVLGNQNLLHDDMLIRNLENVQGIEKDNIIISVGYGPNPEGKFLHNFGPVNQESGSNRLNVLFTRAKKKIILISSVTASDFKLSENPGVNCLKDYLFFAENIETEKSLQEVPYNLANKGVVSYSHVNGSAISCLVQHSSSKVLLIDPCTKKEESKDLYTVYAILKSRFNEVKIVLSIDMWRNKEGMKAQLDDFF